MTLPGQFLLAGAAVMVVATIAVEFWVSKRIEDAVVNNSAFSAALLMENFISPLSQELADTDTLSQPARQALAEVFNGTPIGERVVSYKIWSTDGLVIHASDPSIIGQEFEPSEDFLRAASGYVSASFEDFDDIEDATEAALGVPLLEVYSPIRQLWSGEIIGVAEFYEDATILREDILSAHRTSWLVVGGAFLASGVLLFGIVQAGGAPFANSNQNCAGNWTRHRQYRPKTRTCAGKLSRRRPMPRRRQNGRSGASGPTCMTGRRSICPWRPYALITR
ncbi:hypothetical protein AL073_08465 [Loktanella sp. 1ANDIMAR09]|nr:hypothetical protein AL073_08465 [Loktanella sp. 1ANDIMAR09]